MRLGKTRHITFVIRATAVVFAVFVGVLHAQTTNVSAVTNEIKILELQGTVEVIPAGAKDWVPAEYGQLLHPFDRIHTGANSRVALRWSDQSVVPFGAATEIEILPPGSSRDEAGLHLVRGVLSFFHRDQPGRIRVITRGAVAGVEGTEFVLAVNDADATTLSVIDGKVRFGNERATLLLTNGEQATVALGQAPVPAPGFVVNNLLQWCFYYPAVLELTEVPFTAAEQARLAGSLAAYRAGDLLAALAQYPTNQAAGSAAEAVYHAALLLAVGQVERSETELAALTGANPDARISQLAGALRQLIAAVKLQPSPVKAAPTLATECLAASYYEQGRSIPEVSLKAALKLARQATTNAPKSGFAWARVAELELSFGRTKAAITALEQSLALAPRNAEALALKGFLLAAQNSPHAAIAAFDEALAVDAALGNAWLGRGLCRIHRGDLKGGREDLLVAAALEPQRAELRSYLGKAYIASGDNLHATKELALAKKLDPNDPTAWLYSALQNQKNNEINDAVRDLEKSKALNENRSVYRSQLLLDQDQAVRSANLAGIYRDAGMEDVAVREAGKAVSKDYANYSAHIFLASSYDQLRDPNWSNLRYESPTISEYWIANLLAPTGAGWINSTILDQPSARMFQQNRFGLASDTTYLDRGAWTERADAYYTSGDFSCDFNSYYRNDPGQRPNNDFEQRSFTLNLKGQLTPQDSVFLSIESTRVKYGDVNEYYDPSWAIPDLRVNEKQEPNLHLGLHHEWSPGVHTLFMAGREVGDLTATTADAGHIYATYEQGQFSSARWFPDGVRAGIDSTLYSTELQHIWETVDHTTIIGARYQWGDIHYRNTEWQTSSPYSDQNFPDASAYGVQDFTSNDYYLTVYGYHHWQLLDSLALDLGLSYDQLRMPRDLSTSPFSTEEQNHSQISPKAGFIWNPLTNTTFRAAYTRSLSALANGQSLRIEPTSVAGFNQTFRSIAPDAVAGNTSGSTFDTFDVSLEQQFDTGTYLSVGAEMLYSKLDRLQGAFVGFVDLPDNYFTFPVGLNEQVKYREQSLVFTIDQLLGKQWSVGARYRLSQAKYDWGLVDIPTDLPANQYSPGFAVQKSQRSLLHTVNLHANWNHPSGLFSVLEGNWYHQGNYGFGGTEPGDDFWQCNAFAGYRFWQRRAELSVGLLNVFDQNYKLEPLNLYNEMARDRTFMARLKISF